MISLYREVIIQGIYKRRFLNISENMEKFEKELYISMMCFFF